MKRLASVLLATLLLAGPAISQWAIATDGETATDDETDVTGVGDGIFPTGETLSGVSLTGSQFGIGVIVYADGSAIGTFQSLLLGTSLVGTPQNISINGEVSAGTANADGSVTFGGTAALDIGDGTLPVSAVPFSVTLTSDGALTLVIGATTLATQTLGAGSVTIE